MSLLSDEDIFMRLSQHHVNCVRGEGYTWEEVDEYHLDSLEAFSLIRSIEAAILAKLASAELPEPLVWRHEGYEGWNASEFIEEDTIETYTADQLRQAYAQGFADGAAEQLSAEPVAFTDADFMGIFVSKDIAQDCGATIELYTRREA